MKTLISILFLWMAITIGCNKITQKAAPDKTKPVPVTTTKVQKSEAPVMDYLSPQRKGC